jgi:hypothetical protein
VPVCDRLLCDDPLTDVVPECAGADPSFAGAAAATGATCDGCVVTAGVVVTGAGLGVTCPAAVDEEDAWR